MSNLSERKDNINDTIIIANIENYIQRVMDGNLVLTRITPSVTVEQLFKKDLRWSTIEECKINNDVVKAKFFKQIVVDLYRTMTRKTILQNTCLDIKKKSLMLMDINIMKI